MASVSVKQGEEVRLDGFRKRDGQVVAFDVEKIESAVAKAANAAARREGCVFPDGAAAGVAARVVKQLADPASATISPRGTATSSASCSLKWSR